jgi:hypothetical protein
MTTAVRWLVENRIILSHFSGAIDSEQLLAYLEVSFAMRDAANEANGKYGQLVHTISDGSQITSQVASLPNVQKIMKSLREQKVGWSLYVSPNRLDRLVSSVAHQVGGIRYKAYDTMDKAIQFTRDNDDSLAEVLASPLDFSRGGQCDRQDAGLTRFTLR